MYLFLKLVLVYFQLPVSIQSYRQNVTNCLKVFLIRMLKSFSWQHWHFASAVAFCNPPSFSSWSEGEKSTEFSLHFLMCVCPDFWTIHLWPKVDGHLHMYYSDDEHKRSMLYNAVWSKSSFHGTLQFERSEASSHKAFLLIREKKRAEGKGKSAVRNVAKCGFLLGW